MKLNGFDAAAFLRDHWQQKPALLRQALSGWANPLDPDELAGLACEEDVESRLVVDCGRTWGVEHGPLCESRFGALGETDWTLLVQAVDHHVPEVAALIEAFRFIPNWRIDDVMVSYATQGGGVGPHFDQYDVFLVQGHGRRRWRTGAVCDDTSPLADHADLRLLADFTASEEWVLEPGDVLYLPPGVAHDGVAVDGDCMTYSIGFRAPARQELIGLWADEVLSALTEDDRYADPGIVPQANPGAISDTALSRLQAMVIDSLSDRGGFARWFGCHTTTPKYPDIDWSPEDAITDKAMRAAIKRGVVLERNPASRFAYVAHADAMVMLFVDGTCHDCEGDMARFAEQLCAKTKLRPDPALAGIPSAVALIAALFNAGSLGFADER